MGYFFSFPGRFAPKLSYVLSNTSVARKTNFMKNSIVLIRELLAIKFDSMNQDALLRVIEATPNPEVAAMMLIGLFEEPKIAKESTIRLNAKLDRYDPFKDEVHFTYDYIPSKDAYFHNDVDPIDITLENFDELKIQGSWYDLESDERANYTKRSLATGLAKRSNSDTTLARWIDSPVMH